MFILMVCRVFYFQPDLASLVFSCEPWEIKIFIDSELHFLRLCVGLITHLTELQC